MSYIEIFVCALIGGVLGFCVGLGLVSLIYALAGINYS